MKKLLAAALAAVLFGAPAWALNAPDTAIMTGPNFQQVPAAQIMVTVPNGSQTTLGNALANPQINSLNGVPIGQTTPAPVAATTLSATGATTTTGITDSGGINTTAPTGYRIGGMTIANISGTPNNANVVFGPGAGGNLPITSNFNTFGGWDSGHNYAGAGAGEITGYGNGSCQNLSATATHDTCGGVYSMHYATTETATVSYGGDNMRNVSGTNNNTSNGSYGMSNFFGLLSSSLGSNSLYGNAASILMAGTATNNDVETLTFTSTALAGGFSTASYTVHTSDTCAIRSVAMLSAINANGALVAADMRPIQDTIYNPCVIAIASPNTSVIGVAPLVVTYAVTGTGTETATITGGVNPNDTRLNAIGVNAMEGLGLSTASYDNCQGYSCMAALVSLQFADCMGDSCGSALKTGANFAVVGYHGFWKDTNANAVAGVGTNVGANCISCRNILALGSGALSSTLTTANDIIAITDGSTCDGNTPNVLMVCSGGGTFLQVTGTNTIATSILTAAGFINAVAGYEANGAVGVTCAAGIPTSSFVVTNGIITHC